jgi:hypothetical protein
MSSLTEIAAIMITILTILQIQKKKKKTQTLSKCIELNPPFKQKPLITNAESEKESFFYMILKEKSNWRERVSKLEDNRLFNEEN